MNAQRKVRLKLCPVSRCERMIEVGRVMCPEHWLQLPSETRVHIATLGQVRPYGIAHLAAVQEAVDYLDRQTPTAPTAAVTTFRRLMEWLFGAECHP